MDPEDRNPPPAPHTEAKSLSTRRGRRTVGRIQQVSAAQSELDELLDKISATGMNSLSKSEKERLNELSKRLRGM